MKKKIFLFSTILAAMMLAGCSSHDETSLAGVANPAAGGDSYSVNFDAYTGRSVSRSGSAGVLKTNTDVEGEVSLRTAGFGVFAYYTDLKKYDQTVIPNFMYNRQVTYNDGTSKWEYTPVMYWPNEYGSNAGSDDEDKVSFFAYAPYVAHTSAASGSVTDASYGITGFSRNTTAGDPIVKYIASFDAEKSVDLCWGVCNVASWNKIEGGGTQTMTAGLPWLDVEHPKTTDQQLAFSFLHALAQLNVQIDADVDVAEHSDGDALHEKTKIFVRSISFTGIAMQGALNLNNSVAGKAQWLDYAGATDLPYGQSVTIKDGRRDGREGAAGAEASNEIPQGLNDAIIQKETATTGVTTTLQNLFKGNTPEAPVYIIPTGETMAVTIVYDIETENEMLPGYLSDGTTHGVSVENTITKNVSFDGGGLVSGKKYNLKLHLGLNSVKFDASVSAWEEGADGNGWLPANQPSVALNIGGNALGSAYYLPSSPTPVTPVTINATTYPDDVDITWTNSNDAVATIASADPAPTRAGTRSDAVKAKSITVTPVANAQGTTTITATSILGTSTVVVTVGKAKAAISFAESEVDKNIGDAAFTNALTNQSVAETPVNADGIVTYTSSNTDVATVDPSTGEVTIVAAGTTTITATVEDSENYSYDTKVVSYTLDVEGVALANAAVGNIICSHGYAHAATTEVLGCGGDKVAIVAYVGSAGTADTSEGSSGYVGLAISMVDGNSGNTCKWYTANSGTCITNGQNSTIATALGSDGDWMKGIDNTNRLATAACGAGHEHAAAQAAKNYGVATPTGCSQWFLPTIAQWNLIVKGMCGDHGDLTTSTNNDYKAASFNSNITAAGGTGVQAVGYWSSVEYSTNGAWFMRFSNGSAYSYGKSNDYRVRPVLAF